MPTGTFATTASVAVSMAHTAPAPAMDACSSLGAGSSVFLGMLFGMLVGMLAVGICAAALPGSPLLVTHTVLPSGATCTLCGPRPTAMLPIFLNDAASMTLTVLDSSSAT